MAVVMMGDDEKNPTFHDFLGMTCTGDNKEGEAEAEVSVGLSSERLGANNSEVFHFRGRKNAISEPEASNTFAGRKRSSPSSYMSLVRDRMLSAGSDSLENSRPVKTFGKEVVGEQLGKSHDDDNIPYSMQLPPRPTSSLLLHQPVSTRPKLLISKWEHSLPMNPGSMGHSSSRFAQSGVHMEKLSSSYTYKDVNVGATLIPQPAADEGSRTGMKGSGILNIINSSSSGAGEKNTIGPVPCSSRPKAPQIVEPESSNVISCYNLASSTRQMTIFYAGQAHVFDDVHPNKADVIMALAGSSGVSWTTNCSPRPGACLPVSDAKAPSAENKLRVHNLPVSIHGAPSRGGLVAEVARVPLTTDLQTLTPGGVLGGHQGDRTSRDPLSTITAAEPDRDGESNV